ncbi:MAG: Uma2 family endonuclease [Acidobacteriota bacterium]|nr:Uma2 family endonuclease [Acidobacteriota bacterium]
MHSLLIEPVREPVLLNLSPLVRRMNDAEFRRFCQRNEGYRIEMSKEGVIEVMPPTGGESGRRNSRLTRFLDEWGEVSETGVTFDSSTLFKLPNGAKRSPDAAWVQKEIWEMLTEEERKSFPPICPNFVIELRSDTDRLQPLKNKMQEYLDNGAQLGWLINPAERKVYVYRPNAPVECLDDPETLSGDPLLPGFILPVARIWLK